MREKPTYWLTRLVFQRLLGMVYLAAFLTAALQFRALIGENGLEPARMLYEHANFWQAPGLFYISASNTFMATIAWTGVALAAVAFLGLADFFVLPISTPVWILLWAFYLSFVNAGGLFWGYGWETLLLETGFLAIFIGPSGGPKKVPPPVPIFWMLRWLTFRIMLGAGLIKIRGDSCWRDLTCMFYHYETQPLPNPLSWYFHHLPPLFHKFEVLFTHFVELVVPFGLFGPRRVRHIAGGLTVFFQGMLILSGNLSWLNWLTITAAVGCFDDSLLSRILRFKPDTTHREPSKMRRYTLHGLTALIVILSFEPALNLVSSEQRMNASFNRFHLVNTYGAFGSITRVRHEIVLEGTRDLDPDKAQWREYEFKCKPGDVGRRPCIVAPYQLRLDWQMWFAAFEDPRYNPWLYDYIALLLRNDRDALALIERNPFPEAPPRFIRARYYEYHFTDVGDPSGAWWKRTLVGDYIGPLSLKQAP